REGGGAAAWWRAGRARPWPGDRRGGSAVRVRPVLPRPGGQAPARLRAGSGDRAGDGRVARWHGERHAGAGRRHARPAAAPGVPGRGWGTLTVGPPAGVGWHRARQLPPLTT